MHSFTVCSDEKAARSLLFARSVRAGVSALRISCASQYLAFASSGSGMFVYRIGGSNNQRLEPPQLCFEWPIEVESVITSIVFPESDDFLCAACWDGHVFMFERYTDRSHEESWVASSSGRTILMLGGVSRRRLPFHFLHAHVGLARV